MKPLSFSTLSLQNKLLNSLMLKGKKQNAYNLFCSILFRLAQNKLPPYYSVLIATQKLCPIVESRNINKKRRAVFLVPFPKKFKNPESKGLKVLKEHFKTIKMVGNSEKNFANEIKLVLTGKSDVYELARQKHRQATSVKYLRYRRWF